MSGNDSTSEEVVRLVEACLSAREESGDAGVEKILAKHPVHAEAARQRIGALARAGLLDDADGTEMPQRLGEFRLLRRLGSGGMGVVYLAEQESLGRRVALKLVRPEHLYFPGARERFRREVEAVARLDHPGIAAVHVVGEEAGVPYFAMEFIDGPSLDEVLQSCRGRQPERLRAGDLVAGRSGTWTDACIELAAQIAEALAHSHERGVLHRDIKPTNVMLTASGRVRLVDFGLARSSDSSPLTRTGSAMGSLPYMAPEQVLGDASRIDARTDVYAVGVTLYEMLTLRPAYWSETTERTRERVLEGRPVPIDRLNSAVPWDAETVCLTAMDYDPARRYATMADFASDLRRLLSRQQILARRPGVGLRVRRWSQRRPALATGLALGALIVIGGPIGYALQVDAARTEIKAALDHAERERARAEENLEDSIAAIDEMLAAGTAGDLAISPGVDPVRRQMLERANARYEQLLARDRGNSVLERRWIHAQMRVAQIRFEMGEPKAAEDAARAAVTRCEELAATDPVPDALRVRVEIALLRILMGTGKSTELLERSSRLTDELAATHRTGRAEVRRRSDLGDVLRMTGATKMANGKTDGARADLSAAIQLYEELAAELPEDSLVLSQLAGSMSSLAFVNGFFGRDPNYGSQFERAIELYHKLMALHPGYPQPRHKFAATLMSWAQVELHRSSERESIDKALAIGSDATSVLEELVADYPLRPAYVASLLQHSYQMSWALTRKGDTAGAMKWFRSGVVHGEQSLQRLPDDPNIAFRLAILETGLAAGLEGEESDRHWQHCDELWRALVDRPQPNSSHLDQVGAFYDNWAHYLAEHEQHARALELADLACHYHQQALHRTGLAQHRRRLGISLVRAAEMAVKLHQTTAAVARLRRAVLEAGAGQSDLEQEAFATELAGDPAYEELLASIK